MPDSAASRGPPASDPPAARLSEAAELEIGALEATLPPLPPPSLTDATHPDSNETTRKTR
jgi:hypothetical protein